MRDQKHAWIKTYLAEHFPGSEIEQRYDFNLRAQSFKVHVSGDSFLLKICDEFVDDNDEIAISNQFRRWDIASLLKRDSQQTIFVTSDGPLSRPRQ